MAQIFPTDFEEKLTMAQDDYILFSDSEDGNKIKKAQYKNLKGEKGDPGTPGADGKDGTDGTSATITVGSTTTGAPGSSASVVNSGTSSAAVLDFTIPQGLKGEDGKDGADGKDGIDGAAATISVGSTSTLSPGSSATVTNSGTSSAAVFDFGIPQGATGATGNGIASITSSKVGKITTVTITETNSTVDTFQISDGADGQGSGDVIGPASSVDGDVVVFDGATGKLIKDGSVALSTLSGKQDALTLPATPTQGNLVTRGANNKTLVDGGAIPSTADCVKTSGDQTIAGTKTFSTSPVVPSKTSDATNTGTAIATEAQVYKKQDALTTQTAYTTKGTATKVPTISTNTLGQVTAITETNITFPVTSVNGSTGAVTVNQVPSGGNNGDVLTNVSGVPTWTAPSGGIENVTSGTTTTVTGIRAGSEQEYSDLGSTSASVLYFTF